MVRKSATGRIGIADVAVKAGVSHATVSRVMNGNFTVDPDIAARVRAAAAELKYQPNPVGRSLGPFIAGSTVAGQPERLRQH